MDLSCQMCLPSWSAGCPLKQWAVLRGKKTLMLASRVNTTDFIDLISFVFSVLMGSMFQRKGIRSATALS